MSDDKHGTSLSGWCIDGHHEGCRYAACPCTARECPHANHVAAQADAVDYEGKQTAPAGASTPVGPGPRPSDRKD